MIYRTDYHIHTNHSDGNGSPGEYIPFALKEGISELGFSDHLTLSDKQQDWAIELKYFDSYIEDVLALKSKIGGLKVKLGLEVDYFPDKEDEISKFIDSYPFDYLIGSVHYMDGPVDYGADYYRGKDIYRLFEMYFELIKQAAASGLFDIIGHADLVRLYNFYPDRDIENLYLDLAETISRHGLAIELNTNGKNKPLNDFYPDPAYLHIFREKDIGICVNSDSHYPSHIGQYFDEAYALLVKSGYTRMVTFEERVKTMTDIVA